MSLGHMLGGHRRCQDLSQLVVCPNSEPLKKFLVDSQRGIDNTTSQDGRQGFMDPRKPRRSVCCSRDGLPPHCVESVDSGRSDTYLQFRSSGPSTQALKLMIEVHHATRRPKDDGLQHPETNEPLNLSFYIFDLPSPVASRHILPVDGP